MSSTRTVQPRPVLFLPLYLAAVAVFVYAVGRVYEPKVGLTYLIHFGGRFDRRALPAVRRTPHVVHRGAGHDGQHYAQLALEPLLRDQAIDRALDNPPYRSRRILFSWTAWLSGLGRPAWILQAYAVQNIVCWIMLAALLLYWLPPGTTRSFALWVACLFNFPMIFSAQYALLEGPSMLLIAVAALLAERRHELPAAAVVGLSALGRETNVLGSAVLLRWPRSWTRRELGKLALQLALAATPLLLWIGYVRSIYGSPAVTSAGTGNIGWPLQEFLAAWSRALNRLSLGLTRRALFDLMALVSVTVPILYLSFRRRLSDPWWRVGITFALLMLCLGSAAWDRRMGGAIRLIAPLIVAYNIRIASEPRFFWLLFALGNLTLFRGLDALRLPYLSELI